MIYRLCKLTFMTRLLYQFAFPMVLAGAALTALYAFYLFPYGWSFNLAMTFGSILSATASHFLACTMVVPEYSISAITYTFHINRTLRQSLP